MANNVSVEMDDGGLMVVATTDAPDQATAVRWKAAVENFVGVLTGELTTTVSGAAVVDAARRSGA